MSLELRLPAISWLGEMFIHEVPFPDARLARSPVPAQIEGAGFSGFS